MGTSRLIKPLDSYSWALSVRWFSDFQANILISNSASDWNHAKQTHLADRSPSTLVLKCLRSSYLVSNKSINGTCKGNSIPNGKNAESAHYWTKISERMRGQQRLLHPPRAKSVLLVSSSDRRHGQGPFSSGVGSVLLWNCLVEN